MLGLPYIWGGSNPLTGMDCSGYVQEILAAGGVDPKGDQTAQGLFDFFSTNGLIGAKGAGSLAFYGKSPKAITHVAFLFR
jgi:Cell wall-associated hydrolases (invasion-associated proteins)